MSYHSSDYVSLLPSQDTNSCTQKNDVLIIREVHDLYEESIANRRWFHANPELSFQEFKTAAKIAELLRSYGIEEVFTDIGKTGVVGLIRGQSAGPCVALRADMDALPIQETADIPYRSTNDNVMHACGHDLHVTSLLAAAKVLHNQRHQLNGCVKLIFQPAEEGYNGASAMIRDDVLEEGRLGPKVDFIYGIHIWSLEDVGVVACSNGPVMAASDYFTINVMGSGGHGAMPAGTVDAVVEACALVGELQTIVSRNISPLDTAVITCGTINGGYTHNIIADKVTIKGTTRSFTKETQELIKSRMECVCCGIAQTFGGKIDLDYQYVFPPTINAYPECTQIVINAASKIVGEKYAARPQKTMGAEDFSFFLQERPGCFFFVGSKLPGEDRPHHKSVFDVDERGILISASIFVQIIRDVLM